MSMGQSPATLQTSHGARLYHWQISLSASAHSRFQRGTCIRKTHLERTVIIHQRAIEQKPSCFAGLLSVSQECVPMSRKGSSMAEERKEVDGIILRAIELGGRTGEERKKQA